MSTLTLCLCADDFGQSDAIDDTILALAGGGRLDAVSCLVTGERWASAARRLEELAGAVRIGLHFDLTLGAPASEPLRRLWPVFPNLPRVLLASQVGALPLVEIAGEWRAQWQRFYDATGHAPHFVDGHQHVHHLPGVRELVLDTAAALRSAVRNTGHVVGPGFAFKRMAIEASGGRALQRSLRARGIAHNAALVGCYDFRAADYRALVRRWLAALPAPGGLLFCHPGAGTDRADPIAAARRREAAYLGSGALDADLTEAGVTRGVAGSGMSTTG